VLQAGAPPQPPPASSPPEMARDDPSPPRRTGTTPPPASRRCARAHRRGVGPSPPSSLWSATRPRARASPTTRSQQHRARLPETARDYPRLPEITRDCSRLPATARDWNVGRPAAPRNASRIAGHVHPPPPPPGCPQVRGARRRRQVRARADLEAQRRVRRATLPRRRCRPPRPCARHARLQLRLPAASRRGQRGRSALQAVLRLRRPKHPLPPPCDTPSSAAPTGVGVARVVWPAGEAPSLAECERRCCAEPTCHSVPRAHTLPPARTHPPTEAAPHLHLHLAARARSTL